MTGCRRSSGWYSGACSRIATRCGWCACVSGTGFCSGLPTSLGCSAAGPSRQIRSGWCTPSGPRPTGGSEWCNASLAPLAVGGTTDQPRRSATTRVVTWRSTGRRCWSLWLFGPEWPRLPGGGAAVGWRPAGEDQDRHPSGRPSGLRGGLLLPRAQGHRPAAVLLGGVVCPVEHHFRSASGRTVQRFKGGGRTRRAGCRGRAVRDPHARWFRLDTPLRPALRAPQVVMVSDRPCRAARGAGARWNGRRRVDHGAVLA